MSIPVYVIVNKACIFPGGGYNKAYEKEIECAYK